MCGRILAYLGRIESRSTTNRAVDKLRIAREGAFNEVVAYESGAPPIQGVYLTFDNHGV